MLGSLEVSMTFSECCHVGGVLNGKHGNSEGLTRRQACYAKFASIFFSPAGIEV